MRNAYEQAAPAGDVLVEAATRVAMSAKGSAGSTPAARSARKDALQEELFALASAAAADASGAHSSQKKVLEPQSSPVRAATAMESRSVSANDGGAEVDSWTSVEEEEEEEKEEEEEEAFSSSSSFDVQRDGTGRLDAEDYGDPWAAKGAQRSSGGGGGGSGGGRSGKAHAATASSSGGEDARSWQTAKPAAAPTSGDLSWLFGGAAVAAPQPAAAAKPRALGDEARWRERHNVPQRSELEDVRPSYEVRRWRRDSIATGHAEGGEGGVQRR
jgi:hypothetical protein